MPMDVSSSRPSNKANIFLGLIEYELNSLLGASHIVDYITVHIRFDLERYLLNIYKMNIIYIIYIQDDNLIPAEYLNNLLELHSQKNGHITPQTSF